MLMILCLTCLIGCASSPVIRGGCLTMKILRLSACEAAPKIEDRCPLSDNHLRELDYNKREIKRHL